jgi:putative hemolysin
MIYCRSSLGGYVGDGAFVDRAFNTTDICLVMDAESVNARALSFYAGTA